MKTTSLGWMKRRLCGIYGHKKDYTNIYGGIEYYHCKRCGELVSNSLDWKELSILETFKKEEDK